MNTKELEAYNIIKDIVTIENCGREIPIRPAFGGGEEVYINPTAYMFATQIANLNRQLSKL